jgi:hypothetical protein
LPIINTLFDEFFPFSGVQDRYNIQLVLKAQLILLFFVLSIFIWFWLQTPSHKNFSFWFWDSSSKRRIHLQNNLHVHQTLYGVFAKSSRYSTLQLLLQHLMQTVN